MKRNKWLLLLGVLLLLCGCSRGQEQQKETAREEAPIQIGLSFDSFVIERWIRDRDMFVSTAKALGAEVNVQVANGVVEEQIAQIEYLIQKKMDVIAIIAIDGEALLDVIAKAQSQGIKIICYDRLIENGNTDLYISFDNIRVGELMGEALCQALPKGGKVAAIYGSPTDHNVEQVVEGFISVIESSDLEIVYSDYCENWLAELAYEKMNEALLAEPDLVGVMCGNDDLASQALKALSENRLAGQITLVAQDAELSACQRIAEGTQMMTVFKPIEEEARIAACLAVALAKGEDITAADREISAQQVISDGTYEIPSYQIEPIAVTLENLEKEIIDSGFHSREDVYLNTLPSQ